MNMKAYGRKDAFSNDIARAVVIAYGKVKQADVAGIKPDVRHRLLVDAYNAIASVPGLRLGSGDGLLLASSVRAAAQTALNAIGDAQLFPRPYGQVPDSRLRWAKTALRELDSVVRAEFRARTGAGKSVRAARKGSGASEFVAGMGRMVNEGFKILNGASPDMISRIAPKLHQLAGRMEDFVASYPIRSDQYEVSRVGPRAFQDTRNTLMRDVANFKRAVQTAYRQVPKSGAGTDYEWYLDGMRMALSELMKTVVRYAKEVGYNKWAY